MDDDEYAPRPFATYLVLAVVVFAFAVGAYAGRDMITAFVVNVISPSSDTIISVESSEPALSESDCADDCGRACWLVASGSAESDFTIAQGKIGTLGCDGNCWAVADVVNNLMCCRNADCPRGELCKDGVCG